MLEKAQVRNILKTIYKNFNIDKMAEITLECNPESITDDKMEGYSKSGINRISIGVQSLNNDILKIIGRIHDREEVFKKFKIVEKYFNNISVDMMFGLPNQKVEILKNDLEEVINEKVSDEEIAYLVPFFYKALQNNNKINKKGILVTTYKENIALFLKEDIETEFLIDIDKILTLKSFEQIEKKLDDYDYILTTFSVENDFVKEIKHTKIIELNPILTEKDIKKLENAGLKKNKKIKMTTLLKVILENSSDVNVKKLINSLDEAFSEKIYNDIDKNKFSLGNFLKQENVFKVNLSSFEEILDKFSNLSFLQKSDINDIINRVANNNFYSYLGFKIGIIFHKLNTKNSQDSTLIAINEREIDINSKKISTIILINSNCEKKYRGIIYNFVKLFFLNNEFSFNNNRLSIYDYLISNI